MSSGFVSGGTTEEPVKRDDEWLRVQQELEEERRRKAELGKQDGGKSLYEVLQQNKMAKQDAFEEKIRLKNQFRSLDEDEVDFLDSLLESTRAQEAAVKKETAEQLEEFRRQREQAEKDELEGTSVDAGLPTEEEQWAISSRKRRREKNKDLLFAGKKRRSVPADTSGETSSSPSDQKKVPGIKISEKNASATPVTTSATSDTPNKPAVRTAKPVGNVNTPEKDRSISKEETKPAPLSLGLDAYSDSD